MDIKTIPKLELHCHLDGSLTKSMIQRHLGRSVTKEELTVAEDCPNLTEYLEKFDLPLECLQDEEGLEEGAYTFAEETAKERVEYIEVRFAPMLSVHADLSCAKVIEAVRRGMERAKEDFGLQYGIIVCAMRNHSLEQNLAMLRCAREYLAAVSAPWIWQAMSPPSRQPVSVRSFGKPKGWTCPLSFIPGRPAIWKTSARPASWGQSGSDMALRCAKIRS